MKTKIDETLTRAILTQDLRLRCGLARHTPGVRVAQLFALAETSYAYAEGRTLDEAFEILAANHRESVNALACRGTVETSEPPTDPLDGFVRAGGVVEARCRVVPAGGVTAELEELVVYKTPPEIVARVRESGVAERHAQRGLTYETVLQNNTMRSGSVVTRCIDDRWHVYPWSWVVRRTGGGATLGAALEAALAAPGVEMEK